MIHGSASQPFAFKDCALAAIATGRRARSLRELRDQLQQVDAGSVYYHFWGGRLRPQFDEPEYNNDFAAWTRHALHDQIAAERMAVIDPTAFSDLEDLRAEVLDVIEQRLSEVDAVSFSKMDEQFSFLRSQIVVFDTHRVIERPDELCRSIPQSSTSSIFYHFIDARRRTANGLDDYSTWLLGFGGGHEELLAQLADLDPYFTSLNDLRTLITDAVNKHFPSPSKGGI